MVDQGLTAEERALMLSRSAPTFAAALTEALAKHGPDAQIAVIPDGPNVLAQVK